jgi:hypothetical protein
MAQRNGVPCMWMSACCARTLRSSPATTLRCILLPVQRFVRGSRTQRNHKQSSFGPPIGTTNLYSAIAASHNSLAYSTCSKIGLAWLKKPTELREERTDSGLSSAILSRVTVSSCFVDADEVLVLTCCETRPQERLWTCHRRTKHFTPSRFLAQ